jgi:hypothetical protein
MSQNTGGSISFRFKLNGETKYIQLFPDGVPDYYSPFVYSGKELKAYFSIAQTNKDDVIKCKLVSLENDCTLEFERIFSQSSDLYFNCVQLLISCSEKLSVGELRSFLGSNFPDANSN